ncbi:ABC transporter ATP-binding protein [Vallitalea okinawensis]|uniref:ABC transporter ATP-binding protein n=1 Tax=Vallitalea okinawensis TaxID=2078660 RepID=UPI001FA92686|nr:ABC transporter ATP-binding protein [Vallitalea okinawensis]
MAHHHDEIEYKSYDPEIMKRLMSYAKPYWHLIAVSVLLLLFATGVQLIQPLIIGSAIDTVFETYDKTYLIEEQGDIQVENLNLTYIPDIDELSGTEDLAQIVYAGEQYYLVPHVTRDEVLEFKQLKSKESEIEVAGDILTINNKSYDALQLNEDAIVALRKLDISSLMELVLFYLILLIIGMVTGYFQAVLLQHTGQKIIYNIRNEVFGHIESRSIHYFNSHPVGTLVTRVTNDTETLNEMYTSVIANSIKNVFLLIGIVAMMFSLNAKLSVIVLTILPVIVILTFIYKKFSRENYRVVRTRLSKINAFLSEHIQGMKIIQIFSKEEEVYDEFKTINKKLRQSHIKELLLFGIYRPMMYALYIIGICLVIGFGGNEVLKGAVTIGTLVIFLQYINKFFQPIQELAEQFNILQSAMASAEKIFTVLDSEDAIVNQEEPKPLAQAKGKIDFKNVWFAYEDEEWVLRDVSFSVEPGETVAFVGATGAGKTSILNLISRYYDVQKGNISVDGVNVRDYDKDKLRKNIGQMLQDVFLFTGDIKSNIRLRNEEISREDIEKAAKYVNADYFIQKLPDKYDEKVYERGATLSAGQRQLLSFARTLVFDPSILILDEATANIDTETEQLIQDALEKLMEGRTTLVVAHRLSTIQHADKIIVLHKGKIREMGNHQELLAKKGIYYRLYQLQYQDQA